MSALSFHPLISLLGNISAVQNVGRIAGAELGLLSVSGLSGQAHVGDRARIE